jgi:hypothetical protein
LKALSAVAEARRRQERRSLEEEDHIQIRKRQKCASECSALKIVDYDNLSDGAKSV